MPQVEGGSMGGAEHKSSGQRESSWYRWYVVALLSMIVGLSYLDRYLRFIPAEAIKADLHLTDGQLGMIGGLAFALFNTLFVAPMAALADRTSRKWVISAAVAFWSVMTALRGFARSFAQLFIARAGVGFGEAGVIAPIQAMVASYFPLHERATALAVSSIGATMGIMLCYVLGGWLSEQVGWRSVYIAFGAPGLIIAVLAAVTLREPPCERRKDAPVLLGIADCLRAMVERRTLRWLVLGVSVMSLASQGLSAWVPAFLIRTHDATAGQAGMMIGVASGLFGSLGALLGGCLADGLGRADERWYLWAPAIGACAAAPVYALCFLAPTSIQFLAAFVVGLLFITTYLGPFAAMVQNLAYPAQRATFAAIALLIVNLIGSGAGPPAVGFLSDVLVPYFGEDALRAALIAALSAFLAAGGLLLLAARTVARDIAEAKLFPSRAADQRSAARLTRDRLPEMQNR